jgi:hypothetical protein
MRDILEFTKSVGGHWKILLGGAAAVGALLAAQAFLGLSPPEYIPWVLVASFLLLACWQSWKDEHFRRLKSEEAASPSPQVLVHLDCEADNPKPLTLINASDDAAFNVKVDDIENAGYVARFDVVSHLLKEWVAIIPRVEGNGNAPTELGSLMTVLQAGSSNGDTTRVFPLHVSYTNVQGRPFKMQYDVHYDALTRRAVARLKPAAGRNRASRSWME